MHISLEHGAREHMKSQSTPEIAIGSALTMWMWAHAAKNLFCDRVCVRPVCVAVGRKDQNVKETCTDSSG